jgi:hypothetical protein
MPNSTLNPTDAVLSLPKRKGMGVAKKIVLVFVLAITLLKVMVAPYLPLVSNAALVAILKPFFLRNI